MSQTARPGTDSGPSMASQPSAPKPVLPPHVDDHVDQMLRQTRQHHVQLSVMADVKASMLLTIASVVISLTIPNLGKPAFHTAAETLLVFCLLTIILAAYVAMPKSPGLVRRHPPAEPLNLLFFGHFVEMPYEEYQSRMIEMAEEPARVFEAQVREVYQLGVFLAKKKFRVLRLAYVTFIVGLVASAIVLAFTTAP